MAQLVKNPLARQEGDLGSIPKILQYSGLENSMDCIVHGVEKSWTRLNNFHFHASLFETHSERSP